MLQLNRQTATNAAETLQRSSGKARIAFRRRGCDTVLDDVHQSGCCKVRFPRTLPDASPEAVLINTAGGLTDGDHIAVQAVWKSGARATVTSQAAERIYRSRGEPAIIFSRLSVEENATALWLPQETILFDGGRFTRRLVADIAAGGQLLACESTIFGRAAMGETVENGGVFDVWRIHYGGRLAFADGFRLDGNIQAALDRPALGNGANAIASIVYAGHEVQAMMEPVRAALGETGCTSGCSVIGPVLVVRMLGPSGAVLRHDLINILHVFLDLLDAGKTSLTATTLPRVWSC